MAYSKKKKQPAKLTPRQLEEFSQSHIATLTKTLYSMIDIQKQDMRAKRQVVYNFDDDKLTSEGVIMRPHWRPAFQELRKATYTNSLIGAIIKIRIDDISPYFETRKTTKAELREGFAFTTDDELLEPSEQDLEAFKNASEFFKIMGERCFGWESRDRLKAVGQMMTRDILSIDSLCFFLVKNPFGKVIELRYLDPATIFPVDRSKGYLGDFEISHVQVIDNQVKNQFRHGEIYFRNMSNISDIKYRGSGMSPTETSIMQIVDIIRALRFNSNRFDRPQSYGFLSTGQMITPEQEDALAMQWENMFTNQDNGTHIPIMHGVEDLKYTALNMPNELQFDRLIQILSSLVFANFGMDQAEAGLRLNNSATLSEASADGRIKSSRNRAIKSILAFYSEVFNELLDIMPEFKGIRQIFTGIEVDQNAELDRDKKLLNTYKSLDSIRKKNNEKPLWEEIRDEYGLSEEDAQKIKLIGAIPIDPTFNQWATMTIQKLEGDGGGMGGMGEEQPPDEQGFDTGGSEEEPPEDDYSNYDPSQDEDFQP